MTLSAIMGTIAVSWTSFQTAMGKEVVVEQASVILLDELLFYSQVKRARVQGLGATVRVKVYGSG